MILGNRSPSELRELLAAQAGEDVTYPEVGATWGELPAGYVHQRRSLVVGSGDAAFAAGSDALRAWAAHAAAGFRIVPDGAPLEEGRDVLVVLRIGPLTITAAARIVATVDTADRFGFAYGTLPIHPETGEESFVVHRDPDGTVRFEIVAFSRPSDLVARLGGPVTRLVQARATTAYLEGVRRWVAANCPE